MATANKPAAQKDKKAQPTALERITANLKREALRGKISKDDLTRISELCTGFQHFVG